MIQEQRSSNNKSKGNVNNGADKPGNGKSAIKQRKNRNNTKQTKHDVPAELKQVPKANQSKQASQPTNAGSMSSHATNGKNNSIKRLPMHTENTTHGEHVDDKFSGSSFYLSPKAATLPRPPFGKPTSPEQRRTSSHGPPLGVPAYNPSLMNAPPPQMLMSTPAPMQGHYSMPYATQQMSMGYPHPPPPPPPPPPPMVYHMPTMPMMGPPIGMPYGHMGVPIMPMNGKQPNQV